MGMSRAGFACEKCRDPLLNPDAIVVTHRHARRSAFDGYHERSSDWSAVMCVWCGTHWRTKAKYVSARKSAPDEYWNMELSQVRKALGVRDWDSPDKISAQKNSWARKVSHD